MQLRLQFWEGMILLLSLLSTIVTEFSESSGNRSPIPVPGTLANWFGEILQQFAGTKEPNEPLFKEQKHDLDNKKIIINKNLN